MIKMDEADIVRIENSAEEIRQKFFEIASRREAGGRPEVAREIRAFAAHPMPKDLEEGYQLYLKIKEVDWDLAGWLSGLIGLCVSFTNEPAAKWAARWPQY